MECFSNGLMLKCEMYNRNTPETNTGHMYTQSYYVLFSSIMENKVITRLLYKHYF